MPTGCSATEAHAWAKRRARTTRCANPAAIVAAEQQGLRALYVALTRSTRRLSIVHAEPLPDAMR